MHAPGKNIFGKQPPQTVGQVSFAPGRDYDAAANAQQPVPQNSVEQRRPARPPIPNVPPSPFPTTPAQQTPSVTTERQNAENAVPQHAAAPENKALTVDQDQQRALFGEQSQPPVVAMPADAWRASAAYAQGLGHQRHDKPCQDRAGAFFNEGTWAICLADGAGSRDMSQYGAHAMVVGFERFLTGCFDLFWAQPPDKQIYHVALQIRKILERRCQKHGCAPSELASTLLAVAVKDDRYIAIHIGDGVIGAVRDDKLEIISMPENGEYANFTVFTTSDDLENHIRISTGNASNIAGFILMSDGAGDTLHVHGSEKLAPAVVKLLLYCAEHPDTVDAELQETLEEMLVPKTTDDCAVALLARRPDQLKACLETVAAEPVPSSPFSQQAAENIDESLDADANSENSGRPEYAVKKTGRKQHPKNANKKRLPFIIPIE